ncbi:Retrovirus-related Pol polyprotein from transposon TNT 1-94 [Dendrobium catenatum]|uniref:Retrovirus-related Pol polyprotein from transposon TNT 1-94 n=1 Tax=Dendrobium catenatum TaxID=906689 RepID=A0A2I0XGJ4_9ASPA|nr:Retrovirus-related Pol polyprotein from transposon TNT 1-94 [Dendrobium catenatum]
MTDYLSEIKNIVDQIASAGSVIDGEDVIHYILNGLPQPYQSFKSAIRTYPLPLSLDQIYPLLLSEEINLASDAAKFPATVDPNVALFTSRGRGRRARGKPTYNSANTNRNNPNASTLCQICSKKGHSAQSCWHRLDLQYKPTIKNTNTALLASSDTTEANWFLDSGASSHLTNSLDNLSMSKPYLGSDNVTIGDGNSVSIAHAGAGILPTPSRKLRLSQIFHTPTLKYNLLSISQLTKDNFISINFDPSGFTLKDLATQEILLQGPSKDGLYAVPMPSPSRSHRALSAQMETNKIWHQRLGHPHKKVFDFISSCNPLLKMNKHCAPCESCSAAKCHKLVFQNSNNRRKNPLDLIHSDVWGPAPVISNQGFKFYVIFVDDYTRYTWIYPLRFKSDVFHTFVNFKNQIENLTSQRIKKIRTDGGTEYVNSSFQNYLLTHGISHQISCPYTPEQNGLTERKHRHIIETTRTLLLTASMPTVFWPEAVTTAVYLINRLPSSTTENFTPVELMYNRKPEYGDLKVFGCKCYPLSSPQHRNKLMPTAQPCIFLGYSDIFKGYKCLNSQTNKITVSRHVIFHENIFPFSTPSVNTTVKNSDICPLLLTPYTTSSSNTIDSQTQRLSSMGAESSSYIPARSKTGNLKPIKRMNLIHSYPSDSNQTDLTTYMEASKHQHWRNAMAEEIFALHKQGTWTLVLPLAKASILGSKWTYKTKYHTNGSVAKYKARLVAQGNYQEFGIDYTETFSPVVKLPTIRILLTIALHNSWPVQQLDVANAFLHGTLSETVYMSQPKGFEDNSRPDHVCKLNKAIYGLKKAPRQWYNTFTSFLVTLGFSHSQADPSLLIYRKDQVQIFLLVYVDDILIAGNDSKHLHFILSKLNTEFSMKHLGNVHEFLGINITKTDTSYFLSQAKYAYSILLQAELQNCNALANPNCTKMPTDTTDVRFLNDPTRYRSIIGSLQYLTLTRPDISYSVNILSQHMHDPLPPHFYLLKRLLRYIRGTLHYGLPITKSNLILKSFSDADWAGDPITRKSTSGYCSFLGDTLISWTVKKQRTVSRSSTESEYRALAALTTDIVWLRRLLTKFGISQNYPTDLYCDNMSAIALANNPIFHSRTKHIEIDQKFLRDHIQLNNIRLHPISTIDQVADIFTKSLSTPRFTTLRSKLTVMMDPSI